MVLTTHLPEEGHCPFGIWSLADCPTVGAARGVPVRSWHHPFTMVHEKSEATIAVNIISPSWFLI